MAYTLGASGGGGGALQGQLDIIHARLQTVARQQLAEVANKVVLLAESDRQKYQLQAAKFGPMYEQIRGATQAWMDAYQKLSRVDPGSWGEQGTMMMQAGTNLANNIETLNNTVKIKDWSHVLSILEIGVRAAAGVNQAQVYIATQIAKTPGRVARKVKATAIDVATGAGEVVGAVGGAAGKAVASTLGPIKVYLLVAAGVAALYFLSPVLMGAGSMMSRKKSSAGA